jgi:anti-sigma factor RsiW
MRCDATLLSALSDGDLSPRKTEKVRAHVAGCPACQRALADLDSLKRGMQALPQLEGEDNWGALVNQLASPLPDRRRWQLPWRFVLPSLSLAALCAAGVGGWLHYRSHHRGLSTDAIVAQAEAEFRGADAQYRHAVEKLRWATAEARRDWPPPRRAEYEAAELQLEAAVERCRQIADDRPSDADAEALLFAAYQKQIRFLEDEMLRNGK